MKSYRPAAEVSTSSMADIAFLLLTFFLITTVIETHKGLPMVLPELTTSELPWKERNIFSVHINSQNQFMVEGTPRTTLETMSSEIQQFILNKNSDNYFSESPEKAVVSLYADRGTSHEAFISALDQIQLAYYEIYAQRASMSTEAFRKLDLKVPSNQVIAKKARAGIPMNISLANTKK